MPQHEERLGCDFALVASRTPVGLGELQARQFRRQVVPPSGFKDSHQFKHLTAVISPDVLGQYVRRVHLPFDLVQLQVLVANAVLEPEVLD